MVDKTKMPKITIIGCGLSGVSLAYALRNSSYEITLLDNNPEFEINAADPNARSIALSYGSQKILSSETWQAWNDLKPYTTPIKSIHISDRGHFGRAVITVKEMNLEALGFSIQAQMLYKVLYAGVKGSLNVRVVRPVSNLTVEHETGLVKFQESKTPSNSPLSGRGQYSDLLILAEGGQSNLLDTLQFERKKKDYGQTAIVANVTMSAAHHNQAFERFTSQGPLALLPIDENKMALVWTVTPNEAKTLLEKSDADFIAELQEAFGLRAGYFETISKRSAYPLKLDTVEQPLKNKVLLLGNAAHTIHPVAAQGFNLSLADINALAKCLCANSPPEGLEDYVADRQKSQQQTISFTDSLINLFSTEHFPITPIRGFALSALNNSGVLKRYLAKCVMGYYQ